MIRPLDSSDFGYALFSWRESYKKAPGVDRMPWAFYKDVIVPVFERILQDSSTRVLGFYSDADAVIGPDKLAGWLAFTPGKRVDTVHWCYVKHRLDGLPAMAVRRRGIMTELLEAADLGTKFVYTLHARRDRATLPDGSVTKSLDESLAHALRARGVTATYVALKEWLR